MLGIYWWVMSTPEINQRLKPTGQATPLRRNQPAARHLQERIRQKYKLDAAGGFAGKIRPSQSDRLRVLSGRIKQISPAGTD
jgi:hypothetical protein